jgi:ATP-dependent Clp protease ATP-binding subunit ClpX
LENQDLLKFGMIPEFIGRLPVIATLQELSEEMLIKIMQEPKNALLKQYVSLFKMDGVKLDIKNDALKKIANLAIDQKTGARGLRSIIESLLIDLMFETPDKKDLEKIVINRDVVSNKSDPILIYSNKQTNQKILANKS